MPPKPLLSYAQDRFCQARFTRPTVRALSSVLDAAKARTHTDNMEHREVTRQIVGDYEVVSDGKSAWVYDADRCIARFTNRSQDFYGKALIVHEKGVPHPGHWSSFVMLVHRKMGVRVENRHMPTYLVLH